MCNCRQTQPPDTEDVMEYAKYLTRLILRHTQRRKCCRTRKCEEHTSKCRHYRVVPDYKSLIIEIPPSKMMSMMVDWSSIMESYTTLIAANANGNNQPPKTLVIE